MVKRLSDDLKSSLTAAKLKALCILNDLPTSGNKSDLVARLIESGLTKTELGIEESVSETVTPAKETTEAVIQPSLSLEDEDTLTPEVEPLVEQPVVEVNKSINTDDDILDAEVLDAEFVSLEEEVKAPKTPVSSVTVNSSADGATTLFEMVKQPKFAAVFVVILILGAGTWYYFNNQLEPFTADKLRYGDEMTYTISDGDFMASDGFLDLFLDQFETEDDICKLRLLFSGVGQLAITNGDESQLVSQSTLDRKGVVSTKGGLGMDWLTVESVSTYDLSDLTIQRQLTSILNSDICSSSKASVTGSADLVSTQWTELRDRASIGTAVDWNLAVEDNFQGNLMTFGVGGILGELETLSPGFSMLLQPVELQELLATDYIDDGASGSRLGWDWRVLGTEKLGSTDMWKIVATNQDVQELCLGSASMTLLVEEGNPWATKQTVNVVISGSDSNRQGCSTTTKLLGDYVLPDGELTMSHTFQKSSLTRGSKGLEFGLSYDARPQANELSPSDGDLNNWGPNGEHMPDNSVIRTMNLEQAMDCLQYLQSSASGAVAAIDDGGYIWRAIDQQFGDNTQWNLSWIASDDIAGWVTFNITGTPSQENCQFDQKGSYDETVSYNRDFIPKVLNISTIEESLLDSNRFPSLSSDQGLFTNSGAYHPETRVGYLVVVPGSGINTILSNIGDATDGACTVDMSREWTEDGWDKRFNLIADATDGRIIGWNYVMSA